MKFTVLFLTIFAATGAYAGAGFLCDDYGHSCLSPGGNCSALRPPVHICSDYDAPAPRVDYSLNTDEPASPEIKAAACCSWGEDIQGCMPGC